MLLLKKKDIVYDPVKLTEALSVLLFKKKFGVGLSPTPIGFARCGGNPAHPFMAQQGKEFQDYLIRKIGDAIFKDRIIKSSTDFDDFLFKNKDALIKPYLQLNAFIAKIDYRYFDKS